MKRLVLCVIVLLCGISGGQSRPQGFFGGLLPTTSPQSEGGSPPKRPLAIFTQGQQNAQNVVGGFISGLVETRDKIRNETKKRIQSLLNPTAGNKNKEDPAATSEKPEEVSNPDKEVEEMLPEKLVEESFDIKKKELSKDPEKENKPDVEDIKELERILEKLKQSQSKDEKDKEKNGATKNLTPSTTEAISIDSAEFDKLIEDVFDKPGPSQDDVKEKEEESMKEGGKE